MCHNLELLKVGVTVELVLLHFATSDDSRPTCSRSSTVQATSRCPQAVPDDNQAMGFFSGYWVDL